MLHLCISGVLLIEAPLLNEPLQMASPQEEALCVCHRLLKQNQTHKLSKTTELSTVKIHRQRQSQIK